MSEQHGRTYDPACEVLAHKVLASYSAATYQDQLELAQLIQDTIEDYLVKFKPDQFNRG